MMAVGPCERLRSTGVVREDDKKARALFHLPVSIPSAHLLHATHEAATYTYTTI